MFDEHELVQGILNADPLAYRRFVKQYERLVFYLIRKLIDNPEDVEDLAQEVFMKIFKNLSKFKFESKLSTWIGQVAYREALNYLRKNKTKNDKLNSLENSGYLPDNDQNPEQKNISKDLSRLVQENVKKLPEHYRQVLVLFHLDEFSYPEIGEITGMPEGTVKNYLFRARKILKELLEAELKGETI